MIQLLELPATRLSDASWRSWRGKFPDPHNIGGEAIDFYLCSKGVQSFFEVPSMTRQITLVFSTTEPKDTTDAYYMRRHRSARTMQLLDVLHKGPRMPTILISRNIVEILTQYTNYWMWLELY